jgi:hypothetical protein
MCTAIPVSRDLLSETIIDYNYDIHVNILY